MQFLSSIVLNVSTFLFVNCYANQQLFSSPPRAPPALIPKWYYIIVTMHRSQRRHNFIIICHNSPSTIYSYIYLFNIITSAPYFLLLGSSSILRCPSALCLCVWRRWGAYPADYYVRLSVSVYVRLLF